MLTWPKTKPNNWFGIRIVYYENEHGLTVELGRAAAQKVD
jgi:hypothetical protein